MEKFSTLPSTRPRKGSVPVISTCSFQELCVVCGRGQPDLTCTCGGRFHLSCIGDHVQHLHFEFEFIQNKVGERLLQIEQVVQSRNSDSIRDIVENWVGKKNHVVDFSFHFTLSC